MMFLYSLSHFMNFPDLERWVGPVASLTSTHPVYKLYRKAAEALSQKIAALDDDMLRLLFPEESAPASISRATRTAALRRRLDGHPSAAALKMLRQQRDLLVTKRRITSHELMRRVQVGWDFVKCFFLLSHAVPIHYLRGATCLVIYLGVHLICSRCSTILCATQKHKESYPKGDMSMLTRLKRLHRLRGAMKPLDSQASPLAQATAAPPSFCTPATREGCSRCRWSSGGTAQRPTLRQGRDEALSLLAARESMVTCTAVVLSARAFWVQCCVLRGPKLNLISDSIRMP